jgi:hypothetical protein
MSLRHEHEILALDIEHSMRVKVVDVVVRVLRAPCGALTSARFVVVDDQRRGVSGLRQTRKRIRSTVTSALLVWHAQL